MANLANVPSLTAFSLKRKIFAVSYSIAGLNVLSGNPSDHFVHRHTYVTLHILHNERCFRKYLLPFSFLFPTTGIVLYVDH